MIGETIALQKHNGLEDEAIAVLKSQVFFTNEYAKSMSHKCFLQMIYKKINISFFSK